MKTKLLKKIILSSLQLVMGFALVVSFGREACSQQLVPIATGWSKNAVNAVAFRKNSVVSHNNVQYVAFYDSASYVVIAKRVIGSQAWTVKRTPYTGKVTDAHNAISIMVDGEGYLHVSWDHHGDPLRYCKSIQPGSLDLTDKIPMLGQDEKNVTYPEFYRLPSGDLLFMYRSGGSGRGNLILNKYSVKDKTWKRLHNVLLDGEGQRNAYWQACIDPRGIIHLSWVWRESPNVASNHDIAYACSNDEGLTWQNSRGSKYKLPINASTAEYALRIPPSSELINQTSMCADHRGRPYIVTYWRPSGKEAPQYHVVFKDGKTWKATSIYDRKLTFSLSGAGTKKIPIARPQIMVTKGKRPSIYILFRDAERENRASLATCKNMNAPVWNITDLTDYSLGDWEPSYDTERWKNNESLHLFIQRVGQGDGETLEEMLPQQVSILEINVPE